MKRYLIALAVLTVISILAYATLTPDASAQNKTASPAQAMIVVVTPAQKQDLKETLASVGSLVASESADIRTEIAGKVEKINFEEGAPVKKGDILVEIDNSLIRTELNKAESAYQVALATTKRDSELHKSKYISAQELDESRASVQQMKAERDSAKIRLERTQIKAPFDGVAGLRNFSIGDYIDLGGLLTTIDAYDPIKIEFSVPERNFSDIRTGQTITFVTDAWRNDTFEGTIYAVDSRINPQTRSFNVKALASNGDSKLRAGMYARITIEVGLKENAITIPEEAINPANNKNTVFVVIDGKAVSREVTLGLRTKGHVEITQGLEEGEPVITAGIQRIRDGMEVTIRNTPASEEKAR